ncbi:MAG TPA: helicase-associated domain-containing protein [Nitrolancea sp.]|nr:helicase-associated domain-containing protein [Nitrolancea sp.]
MRNLLGRLHDRTPHELDMIARWWEIELRGRDRFTIAGHLYRIMSDAWSFALAWERLTAAEHSLLTWFAGQEEAVSVAEIGTLDGLTAAESRAALEHLVRIGFISLEQDEPEVEPDQPPRYFLPRELAQLTTNIADERQKGSPASSDVDELLDRLNDGALADIAEHMGRQVIPAVALRSDLLAQVGPRLADPEHLRATVRGLSPTVARLWRYLIEQPDPETPERARAALGQSHAEQRLAVQGLAQRGLLWRGYDDDGRLRLVVPDLLRHPRKRPEPPPPELQFVDEHHVEAVDWVFPYAAAWDLLTLLRAGASGLLGRRHGVMEIRPAALRRLALRLWRRSGDVPPTGYLRFLDDLANGLSLTAVDAHGMTTERMRTWTLQSFEQQTRDLFNLWSSSTSWLESAERETVQIWGGDWPAFRRQLLTALGELSPGRWLTLESFAARFVAGAPGALGPHFTAAASHDQRAETVDARRRAILQTVTELTMRTALEWLGLLTISTSRRRTVVALTPVGAWLSGQQDEPPEAPELGAHPLAVLPSFEIVVPRPTPRRVWALSAFADLIRLDRISSFELTQASIGRGLSAGLSTAQIIGYLEQQSSEALPQNVAFEIDEWARGLRRVVVRETVLLEPDSATSSQKIADALTAAGFRVESLADQRLLVSGSGDDPDHDLLAALDKHLRELGHTPLLQPPVPLPRRVSTGEQ